MKVRLVELLYKQVSILNLRRKFEVNKNEIFGLYLQIHHIHLMDLEIAVFDLDKYNDIDDENWQQMLILILLFEYLFDMIQDSFLDFHKSQLV